MPKMCFLRNRSSYSFETCSIAIGMAENLRGALSLALYIQRKLIFQPKMCFLRSRSSYSFENCTIVISMAENTRVHWVWPSKYKRKQCFSPKCVFSEMDHHTALKLLPMSSGPLDLFFWIWTNKVLTFANWWQEGSQLSKVWNSFYRISHTHCSGKPVTWSGSAIWTDLPKGLSAPRRLLKIPGMYIILCYDWLPSCCSWCRWLPLLIW